MTAGQPARLFLAPVIVYSDCTCDFCHHAEEKRKRQRKMMKTQRKKEKDKMLRVTLMFK